MSTGKRGKILVLDGQVFQSDAWDRGMGKYSLSLIAHMMSLSNIAYKDVRIVFTNNRPLKPVARKEIIKIIPASKHIFCDLLVPDDPWLKTIESAEPTNKKTLNRVIHDLASESEQVDFVILSLFTDHSFSVFPDNVGKVLIGYDLIPFLYSERYAKHPNFDAYLSRYKWIIQADVILTISQTVADDFVCYLGIPAAKVRAIHGGPIERSHIKPVRPKIEIGKRFILMPSGDDIRKNNLAAVRAFASFTESNGAYSDISLVVTSNFTEHTKAQMLAISSEVIFTDNVSESEIRWLYENSEAVLFIPEYEGLGLPILEAMVSDKPIICSNISVFRELSQEAMYFVDHFSVASISLGIESAIKKVDWHSKRSNYAKILRKYSWKNVATEANKYLGELELPAAKNRTKIAVFTPDPEGYSAIGKVVMQQHASLSEYFDVDYYTEKASSEFSNALSRPSYLHKVANVFGAKAFTRSDYRKYAAVFYHIGNSEFHVESVKNALYLPGIAIVHDTDLSSMFLGPLWHGGFVNQNRIDAEKRLNDLIDKKETAWMSSLLHLQRAVITHSKYAKRSLASSVNATPIIKAELPVGTPCIEDTSNQAGKHIGIAGILHSVKGIQILEELVRSKDNKLSECTYYLFGMTMMSDEETERFKRYPNLIFVTSPSDFEFQTLLSNLDILINYRPAYRGETSLTVLEAMRHGVVPVVRNVGWYDELPDDTVSKVATESDVKDAVLKLISDETYRKSLSENAVRYTRDYHTFSDYAAQMSNLVDSITAGPGSSVNERITKLYKSRKSEKSLLKKIRTIIADQE